MKIIFSILMMLFSSNLLAQSLGYELRINLLKNNAVVATPNVVVEEKQKAAMSEGNTRDEMYFEIQPQASGSQDILLKITVGDLKKGRRIPRASYEKVTRENVDTTIPFEHKNKKISRYSMRILVMKKALESNRAPEAGPMLISF